MLPTEVPSQFLTTKDLVKALKTLEKVWHPSTFQEWKDIER